MPYRRIVFNFQVKLITYCIHFFYSNLIRLSIVTGGNAIHILGGQGEGEFGCEQVVTLVFSCIFGGAVMSFISAGTEDGLICYR